MRGRAAAVVLVVVLAGCGPSGHDTPRATVDSYLAALSGNRAKAISRLAEPYDQNVKVRDEVTDQLSRYGGKKLEVTSLEVANGSWVLTDSTCDAVVQAHDGAVTYQAVIHLQLQPTGGWLISGIDQTGPAAQAPPCKS